MAPEGSSARSTHTSTSNFLRSTPLPRPPINKESPLPLSLWRIKDRRTVLTAAPEKRRMPAREATELDIRGPSTPLPGPKNRPIVFGLVAGLFVLECA